ncbi:MAG: hypothetical protein KDB22_06430 [Planctomycetales bacterium]|nr:hypothetical protein [Planctomycetales bacterium]
MDMAFDQAGAGDRNVLAPSGLRDFSLWSIGLRPVTNFTADRDLLVRRRAGKIVTQEGSLRMVSGRWLPYCGNMLQFLWDTKLRTMRGDRCELFYHQPLGSSEFITLSYTRSGATTSLATFYAATLVLDEIARLKGSKAIVCHVTNSRISDRLMARWGWQQHCLQWSGRHFIKRFYGEYPEIQQAWRVRLQFDEPGNLQPTLT